MDEFRTAMFGNSSEGWSYGESSKHGFGRIGRSLMKVALKQNLFVPVSISDIKDAATLAALFEVDSNYGRWHEDVLAKDGQFVIGGRKIPYFDSMKALPYSAHHVLEGDGNLHVQGWTEHLR
jgi:glyceraldehyde-3-phosphate dehydrogenase/erythrose-4-phosphate dehydrogenase